MGDRTETVDVLAAQGAGPRAQASWVWGPILVNGPGLEAGPAAQLEGGGTVEGWSAGQKDGGAEQGGQGWDQEAFGR